MDPSLETDGTQSAQLALPPGEQIGSQGLQDIAKTREMEYTGDAVDEEGGVSDWRQMLDGPKFAPLKTYEGEIQVIERFSPGQYVVKMELPVISGVRGHFQENLTNRPDRAKLTKEVAQGMINKSKLVLYQANKGVLKFISDDGYVVLNMSKEAVTAVPERLRAKYKRYLEGK